jgi:hypothetical protein
VLTLEIDGRPSTTIRQGDAATFEVRLDGRPAEEVLVDFEGTGRWEPARGAVFRRTYREPGRFLVTARCGDEMATARVHVTRVSVTGGVGIF